MKSEALLMHSVSGEAKIGAATEKLHTFIDTYLDHLKYPAETKDANDPRYRAKLTATEEAINIMKEYPDSTIQVLLEGSSSMLFMYFRYGNADDFDNLSRAKRVRERIRKSTGHEVFKSIQKKQAASGMPYAGMGNYYIMEYADGFAKMPIFKDDMEGTAMMIVIKRHSTKKREVPK